MEGGGEGAISGHIKAHPYPPTYHTAESALENEIVEHSNHLISIRVPTFWSECIIEKKPRISFIFSFVHLSIPNTLSIVMPGVKQEHVPLLSLRGAHTNHMRLWLFPRIASDLPLHW